MKKIKNRRFLGSPYLGPIMGPIMERNIGPYFGQAALFSLCGGSVYLQVAFFMNSRFITAHW